MAKERKWSRCHKERQFDKAWNYGNATTTAKPGHLEWSDVEGKMIWIVPSNDDDPLVKDDAE